MVSIIRSMANNASGIEIMFIKLVDTSEGSVLDL